MQYKVGSKNSRNVRQPRPLLLNNTYISRLNAIQGWSLARKKTSEHPFTRSKKMMSTVTHHQAFARLFLIHFNGEDILIYSWMTKKP